MNSRSPRAQITALASVVFVDLLGLALILPSLPFFVLDLGAGGLGLGLILTSYSLTQVLSAPVLGRLSDRYGRRRLLLLSLAGSASSFAVTALAHDVTLLVAARVLAGLCGGSITVAYAFASDMTTREDRTVAMSRVGAGIGLAFTIGPAIGAALSPLGFAAVCWAGAIVAVVNLFAAWRVLPRPAPASSSKRERPHTAAGPMSAPPVISWVLITLVISGAIITASFVSMETTVGLLVEGLYGYGPVGVGSLLAAAGLSMVLVQVGLSTRRARHLPGWTVTITAMALVAIGLAAVPIALATSTILGTLLLSGSYGAFVVTQASLISQYGPPTSTGVRLGWSQSANAAGRACAPLTAGLLYDMHSPLPYLTASILAATTTGVLIVAHLSHGRARRQRNVVDGASECNRQVQGLVNRPAGADEEARSP